MKIAFKPVAALFAGVIIAGLAFVSTQANAGAIDEFGRKVVVTVVESLTQDLRDGTPDGKEHQEFVHESADEPGVAAEQKTRNQKRAECGARRC